MLKHKYIKRACSIAICSLVAFGCTDLETEFSDSIPVTTDGGATSGDPAALLSTNYNRLGDHIWQDNVMALLEHPTDEMMGPTRGTDWGDNGIWRQLHQHTWDPTHNWIRVSWNSLNSLVFISNQVLGSNPTPQQAAEAKFLRAFNMFYIMDLFGQVPFREIDEGVEVDPRVLSRSEAFEFIINDLEEAIPNLPEGMPGAGNDLSVPPGKASKAAAYALLARLYLNKAVYLSDNPAGPYTFDAADMNKVIEYADLVTASGFSLDEDYFQNFQDVETTEKILTTPKSVTAQPEAYYYMGAHYNMNPGGWNGFVTLADFYDKFSMEDERLGEPHTPGQGFKVGPQVDANGEPILNRRGDQLTFTPEVQIAGNNDQAGIRVYKYHPDVNIGSLVLLRYADVYLMKIEAILRGGTATGGETAQSMLDALRALRGVESIPATLETILDERGRELYWERVRRTDQIRFGTFTDTWHEKTVTDPTKVLFPIPQVAIDSNPNLEQNPGY
ncbi:RagB/SusD family nutrient uptake outer membrane protein [Cesiribacter sp. SM1]|uniref:RagB/SusD family nutrient uptake outer membrane protein n=1 Tax=Cesiribacter sp. SM1 TaxID=2861196 RepID=UPI001CD22C80|nr:RagB/SusD family nutrient uptake outer membrane protein [Cesiribacter sp. SM1]